MSAQIIQFPHEVREDIAMARGVQRAFSRLGWAVQLQEIISICRETRTATITPELEAMARKIANELNIELKPGALS
jgi:putative aminopeptidase FrvX